MGNSAELVKSQKCLKLCILIHQAFPKTYASLLLLMRDLGTFLLARLPTIANRVIPLIRRVCRLELRRAVELPTSDCLSIEDRCIRGDRTIVVLVFL